MSENNLHVKMYDSGKGEWNRFVSENEQGNLYHSYEWGDIIESTLSHKKIYLAAYQNEKLTAVLPLFLCSSKIGGVRMISMPFLNYGGVCSNDDLSTAALYEEIKKMAAEHKVNDVELRNDHIVDNGYKTKLEKATYILQLKESEEATFKAIRKATRNRVRKSESYGLRIEKGTHLLDEFYEGFAQAMKEHGTPVLSKEFFREAALVFNESLSFYAAFKDKEIAGVKCMINYKSVQYQIWGGYPSKFKKSLPNYFLTWQAIKDAHQQGLSAVDLGRSTVKSGPADFKRYFGCDEQKLYWEYPYLETGELPDVNPQNPKYRAAIKIWRKLPLSLTKIIGPPLARQLP